MFMFDGGCSGGGDDNSNKIASQNKTKQNTTRRLGYVTSLM